VRSCPSTVSAVEIYKLVEGEYSLEGEPQSLAWVCNSAVPELD
jgi:hypothetical protein